MASCSRSRSSKRSRRASCTSTRIQRKKSACICPKAITCSAPGSSTTRSSRRCLPRIVQPYRRTSFSTRSSSSVRFESTTEKETRKKILTCDPESGRACVERIITDLARRAYRRPPAPSGDRFAAALRGSREDERPIGRAGDPARDSGDARVAEFPVPHRARSRSAQSGSSCTRCRRSSWRRASAISCGARCRTRS